jgi:hypothetical protein
MRVHSATTLQHALSTLALLPAPGTRPSSGAGSG